MERSCTTAALGAPGRVGTSGKGGGEVAAEWAVGGEHEAVEDDLGGDGSVAIGEEEQPEVPFLEVRHEDRGLCGLLDDFGAEGDLDERFAVAHLRLGGAAFGAVGSRTAALQVSRPRPLVPIPRLAG